MKTAARSILNAALRLPEREQVELATELLAHLEGAGEGDVDAAWAAEVERRTREIERGVVKPVPWSAVKRAAVRRTRALRLTIPRPASTDRTRPRWRPRRSRLARAGGS